MNKLSLKQDIATFFPGYFALVMATGIIAIASYLLNMQLIAFILHYINIGAYFILWGITILRLFFFFPNVVDDIRNHLRGPGFFTLIAGTCVLGNEMIILEENFFFARVLWIVGALLWTIVIYSFLGSIMVREDKPTLDAGINGAWLLTIVSTQSLSILGALLSPQIEQGRDVILFISISMFLLGCMLYIIIITLIFYRFTFSGLTTKNLTPPYWINMGAVAISTLAGATLIIKSPLLPFLQEILPFLKGFTLFFWATGTWWIPLLFILGFWRHIYKQFPLEYDPQYWGMVFPLGMYTTCTLQLMKATGLSFLYIIPKYFIYIALIAWISVFGSMFYSLFKRNEAKLPKSMGKI